MRKCFFYFFIAVSFLIFLFGTLAFFPFVSGACSLGASPLEMSSNAKPGQIVEVIWNFFNLAGDRATHVSISQAKGPNWEINYEPEIGIKQYEVSGILTNSSENFAMDKSVLTKERPEPLPAGKLAYIVHPNLSEGYILVDKQERILITIPENAEIGKQEDFVFEAIGNCFGETGTISASLAIELKVKITPTTEYYEKPLEEETSIETLGKKIVDLLSGGNIKPVYMISAGTTLILVILLAVLLIISYYRKIRKESKEGEGKIKARKKKGK